MDLIIHVCGLILGLSLWGFVLHKIIQWVFKSKEK